MMKSAGNPNSSHKAEQQQSHSEPPLLSSDLYQSGSSRSLVPVQTAGLSGESGRKNTTPHGEKKVIFLAGAGLTVRSHGSKQTEPEEPEEEEEEELRSMRLLEPLRQEKVSTL